MADPLSVAGLAAGLVSLGLQVAGGISSYLDAIKSRSDELASVERGLNGIRIILTELESACSQSQAQQPASGKLNRCIEACTAELNSFDDLSSITQGATGTHDPKFRQRLREKHQQLVYPLKHRPRVERLESRIRKLHGTLQTSLQAVALELALSSARSVANMHMEVALNRSETQALSNILTPYFQSHDQQLQVLSSKMQELVEEAKVQRTVHEHGLSTPSTSDYRVRSLASKQGSLSPLPREAELYHGLVSCDCPIRTSQGHARATWGPASFFTQSKAVKYHLPDCRFSVSPADEMHRTYGFSFIGLQSIINKAMHFSITMHCKAGSFSIAPAIKYQTVVDGRCAPAFRLVALLEDWLFMIRRLYVEANEPVPSTHTTHWSHLVNHCLSSILQLFRQGKAHPEDVNQTHENLVLKVVSLIRDTAYDGKIRYFDGVPVTSYREGTLGQFVPDVLVLLKALVACRVPTMTYTISGRSPLYTVLGYHYNDSVQAVVDILTSGGNEVLPILGYNVSNLGLIRQRNYASLLWRLASIPVLADACEVNPFFEAILADNEEEALRLLLKNPAYMREVTAIGQTGIHLAVGKPRCLRMLVQHAEPGMLSRQDAQLITPLELSMIICRQKNCPRNHTVPSGRPKCSCAESAQILLEAGCSLMIDFVFERSSRLSYPIHVKEVYAYDLLRRREDLKTVALHYLTTAQSAMYALHSSSVLDANLAGVIESLQAMRVPFEPTLVLPPVQGIGKSVYHQLQNAEDAELLYSLGFRDTSACSSSLLPPMFLHIVDFPYVLWLYRHGVDILQPLDDQLSKAPKDPLGRNLRRVVPGITGAHYIAERIGNYAALLSTPDFRDDLGYETLYFDDEPAFQQAIITMTPIVLEDVKDKCTCECLIGSAPIDKITRVDPERRTALSATLTNALLGRLDGPLSMCHLRSAVRYLTYEAMDLRHTCCVKNGKNGRAFVTRSFLNELDEIADDDAADRASEHQRFHQVLGEVFDELESYDSGLGLVDIKTAQDYIENSWVPRMEFERGSGGSEPDEEDFDELVERTRELGVVWHGPVARDDGAELDVTVDLADLKDRLSSLEFWVADADRIMRGESTSGGCRDTLVKYLQTAKYMAGIRPQ
ncbi:hypothetical protein PG991_013283 [Apiospora marii]|uniref:Fungal N-terminal domain-containing protein n=1 Tax=Apiospora marii TaxID=335849 RepID=A0ABR1R5L3_9PEZI